MQQDPGFFSGILLFVLLTLAGIACLYLSSNHRTTVRFQTKLFVCAISLRFLMSLIIYEFGLVNILKDEDASGWVMGVSLYKEWLRKRIEIWDLPSVLTGAFAGQHHGYGFLVGTLFYLTDMPDRLAAAALNCLIGALTVVLVYRIARSLFSESVAVKSAWWACLLPSMLIWSSQTLKEPTIIFLETVVMYGCIRLKLSGFSLRHVIACALAIVLVLPFRFYAAYIAGAAIAVALVMPQFGKRKMGVLPAICIALCLIPISGIFGQSEAQIERFDLEHVQKFRQGIAKDSGSGVTSSYDLKSPSGLVMATLVGGAHLMLAPFPWQLGGGSVRMILTTPELLVWWWLFFVGVAPGLWYAVRHRFGDIQPMLFFIFGLGLLYSMMFGNVGLAYRQRAQLLPWLLIFAMVGLEQRAIKRARNKTAAQKDPKAKDIPQSQPQPPFSPQTQPQSLPQPSV